MPQLQEMADRAAIAPDGMVDFKITAAIVSSGRTEIEVASAASTTLPNPVRDIPIVLPRAIERLLVA
ncbi:hypothetical protein [Kibdelosporangium phytohabitans]|uniref:hypothetical protein n=1 Tax=Kibdelosporangium phytohabitans TaxID=860235 RepID=UPI0012FAFD33|nr:hypothetical protein [Kibdelosporangium phytohabitans]MBE1462850.1 hypothetical protein [Kibdelosporangium phytohabitans]